MSHTRSCMLSDGPHHRGRKAQAAPLSSRHACAYDATQAISEYCAATSRHNAVERARTVPKQQQQQQQTCPPAAAQPATPHLPSILAGSCCVRQIVCNLWCSAGLRLAPWLTHHRVHPLRLALHPAARPALPRLNSVDAPAMLLALLPVALVALAAAKHIHTVALQASHTPTYLQQVYYRRSVSCSARSLYFTESG